MQEIGEALNGGNPLALHQEIGWLSMVEIRHSYEQ
jgi:hypothetical protein